MFLNWMKSGLSSSKDRQTLAMDRYVSATRQIVALVIGDRSEATCQFLWRAILNKGL